MFRRLQQLPYRALFRLETLKRTMPFWLLIALTLAVVACGKKK